MAVEEGLNSGGGDHRWTTATTATLQTRFNPCVIERLLRRRPKKADLENSPSSEAHHPHHHHFIIGTYELVEEGSELTRQYSASELTSRNRRVGTLELLKIKGESGKVVHVYESPYGGVFDLRVLDDHDATHHYQPQNEEQEEEDQNLVVTAHANGVVALYLIYCGNSARIELLKSWSTSAAMLTTVEIIKGGKAAFCFYAGAESGELLRVNWWSTGDEKNEEKDEEEEDEEEEVTSLGKLTDYGHPIWYLRAVEISVSTGETHLLFIGSEDSKWRVVVNDDSTNEPGSTTKPLYVNADAEAGVTAFEFLLPFSSSSSSSSSPSSPSSSETSGELKVLVGSYDEHLRLYRMRFSSSNSSTSKTSIDSVNLLYRIPITGGGVWRIRTFPKSSDCQVLIAAMYAGVRLLTFEHSWAEIEAENEQKWPKDCCEEVATLEVPSTEKSPNENTSTSSSALIYGIAATEDLSVVTFASFYQRELYVLFKRNCSSLIEM